MTIFICTEYLHFAFMNLRKRSVQAVSAERVYVHEKRTIKVNQLIRSGYYNQIRFNEMMQI